MSTDHRKMRFPLAALPVALAVLAVLAVARRRRAGRGGADQAGYPRVTSQAALGLSRGIAVNNDHASPTYGDLYVTEAIDVSRAGSSRPRAGSWRCSAGT